jgi:hypothetical protein
MLFALTAPTGYVNWTDLPQCICGHKLKSSLTEKEFEQLRSGMTGGPVPCFCQLQQAIIRDICNDQLSQRIAFKFENDCEKFRREVENMMGSLDYFVSL